MDNIKKKRGRPPAGATTATKNLGQVRVTAEQIDAYSKAAALEDEPMATWVKRNLDRIAKRKLKP